MNLLGPTVIVRAPSANAARRNAAVTALNARLWPGSDRVTWTDFAEPNPWPLLVQGNDPLLPSTPLAARVASAVRSLPPVGPEALLARWNARGDPAGQGWTLWLAPSHRLVLAPDAASFGVVGPQGRLHRRLPIRAGDILEVRVVVAGATREQPGSALLTVRFPASAEAKAPPPPPKPDSSQAMPFTIRLVQGENLLLVPIASSRGDIAEVEISFVDRLPGLDEVTVRRIPFR